MNATLEVKALAVAVLASTLALGGALLLAVPVKWLFASTSEPAETAAPEPPGSSPAVVEQGHQFFEMSCSQCHGDDAHGDEGPDLHNLTISDARITATIKKGVKGEMPTFSKKYNDRQVAVLVAYLRTLH